ncbi:hypothetical protein [Kingella sp. (in: b-proteobacteria)]|uniref:hypothetical protein n=1 Tax=Kingella sp. (in: b-proteobacteria) TaxID=2020713 RepID=UPI0026DDC485|nr:hypothetical protein [Kingella sp. (in: b-proteobacteria)]MDO4656978.1 hypothetical protein [Kingella sp. (in: b-proteobacteria)]
MRVLRFQTALYAMQRQPETFAKPVTDGASAARRHFGKTVVQCLKHWQRAVAAPF